LRSEKKRCSLIWAEIQKPLNSHFLISTLGYQTEQAVVGISVINNKLLGLLAIILLVSSCASLAVASTTSLTNYGNPDYTPLQGSFPFPFATPTPTPTPTPTATPEPTPTPTPKPEPTAKPALEIYCISTAVASSLKVDVTGTLTYNETAIPGAVIYVGYSADGGNKWENFSLVQTQSDGGYEALWTPNATGNYQVSASWVGNDSLHWMNATINLATMSDSVGNEFSVVSNATVSSLSYNSTRKELNFNTNGTAGTIGYAQVCIPKNLASDAKSLTLNINGKSVVFAYESQGDVWVISCVYAQSQQAFTNTVCTDYKSSRNTLGSNNCRHSCINHSFSGRGGY
jgi:hypothetical protein